MTPSLNIQNTRSRFARGATLLLGSLALTLLGACAATRTSEGTGEYLDDTMITTKVKAAVLNDPTLKSSEINVETFKGRVQLSGFVNSRADMDKATALAREVKGVTTVSNDMKLK